MTFKQFSAIVEIRTKIISISTFFLATAYAYWASGVFSLHLVILIFFAALAVDMGTTGFNTFFDYLRGVDHIDYNRESAKVLVHEGVSAMSAFIVSAACFMVAGILGIIIAVFAGWKVLIAGGICMVVGFFYTGGPMPISRTPVGELFAGGFLGSVFFLIVYYIYTGAITADAVLVSLPSTVFIASILTTNNTCDIEGDKRARRKTLAVVLGRKRSSHVIWIEGVIAFLGVGALALLGLLPIWCALLQIPIAIFAAVEYRRMFRRGFSHGTKGPSMGSISRIFLLFSAAMFFGLVAGGVPSLFSVSEEVDDDTYEERQELYLGTVVTIRVYGNDVEPVIDEGFRLVEQYENLLSRSKPESDVSRINDRAGDSAVSVAASTIEVVREGIRYGELSDGLFDITIGPLVDLWGIGTAGAQIPGPAEIESTISLIDFTRVSIEDERSVKLPEPGMKLDLGGIAKGYIADRLAELFRSRGIEHAIINLGGNIHTIGRKPDGDLFRIAIQHPESERGEYVGIVRVEDRSVISSGVYERFFVEDGIRYHHILNPGTGYPVRNGLVSVSIICDRSVDGDGLSTAVFCLGLEDGMKLIESIEGIETVIIDTENRVYLSSGLDDRFELTNPTFELSSVAS